MRRSWPVTGAETRYRCLMRVLPSSLTVARSVPTADARRLHRHGSRPQAGGDQRDQHHGARVGKPAAGVAVGGSLQRWIHARGVLKTGAASVGHPEVSGVFTRGASSRSTGVRPSPGAATSARSECLVYSGVSGKPEPAAPGDGRPPAQTGAGGGSMQQICPFIRGLSAR